MTFTFFRYTDLGARERAQTSQVTYVSGAWGTDRIYISGDDTRKYSQFDLVTHS